MANRVSPAELAQVQAMIDQHPQIQAALKDPRARDRYEWVFLNDALKKAGIQLPPSYRLGNDGQVTYDDGTDWMKWAIPAGAIGGLGVGAFMGGPAAGGAMSASEAAGAPAATEAGIFGSSSAGQAAAGAGAGASGMSRVPWGDIARTAAPLAGAGIASALSSNGASNTGGEMPPELRELLNLQLNRIKSAQPNYDLMLRMARGLTPRWAREGGMADPRMAEPR